ncbi:U3 small nucleolar ribonucleoprotein protein IMP3 isoform X2 [Latimeria chalumnae]|uniref:U3 small nucleolar ribonucleoprotein protein IMP3 isoform X2 n=1 Tax=Latimeria chalumnae TaxID=7897 RepID=UPI0003C190A2|nr:PREDICTED: U3 small nucleolar ribonucleoprotein protein IMP3 isoform X2 [Latimeria chalumnae]|eukprot:XP_005994131.1 PREDICTED: U3 small nucleolar ribonucleoprotein protein IMP3 isoform X2 [Latimeria chalumnae]
MVRKLKFHEQKLLKKVDFISWEVDQNLHEVKVLRKFHLEKREDYTKYVMGLIPTKQSLQLCERVSASSFCRRRLPSIMLKLRMAQNLKTAITFIEQGHVRVGPEIVTDPAFLMTRTMEDFVTWVDSSKIKQHVKEYNEERDDFDLTA